MRWIVGILQRAACLAVSLAAALPVQAVASGDDRVAIEYHCAGVARLAANTNLVALNKILALPSAAKFRELVLQRMSRLAADSLNLGTNWSTVSLFERMWADVFHNESMGTIAGPADGGSFVLALRVDEKSADLWRDNLAKAFGKAAEKFVAEDCEGWQWNRGASNSFWLAPSRGWLIVGAGDGLSALRTEYLRGLKQNGRPRPELKENWLEARMNLAQATSILPDWAHYLKPARVSITILEKTNHFRTEASLVYPEPVPWKAREWQIPTEHMKSPLDSFTVAQDLGAFLKVDPNIGKIAGGLLTNQYFAWAMGEMPLQTYVAWPVADGSNAMDELSTTAPAELNPALKKLNGSELAWQPKFRRLYCPALGIGSPDLSAVQDNGRSFLLSTMFPLQPGDNPAPEELLKRVEGHTNLIYFDWETTGPRLQEWRLLGDILFKSPAIPTTETAMARGIEEKWFNGLRPLGGNTVTQATFVAPNEVSIVRNSPVGLTGFEIYLLTDWMAGAGFHSTNSLPAAH
jgi:hypothetical protein